MEKIPNDILVRWRERPLLNVGPARHWLTSLIAGVWGYNENQANVNFWTNLGEGDPVVFYASQEASGIVGLGIVSHTYLKDAPIWVDDFIAGGNVWPRSVQFKKSYWLGNVMSIPRNPAIHERSTAQRENDILHLTANILSKVVIKVAAGVDLPVNAASCQIRDPKAVEYLGSRLAEGRFCVTDYSDVIDRSELEDSADLTVLSEYGIDEQIQAAESNISAGTTLLPPAERKKRAHHLYRLLKMKYSHMCQCCKFSILKKSGKYYIEACHIRPHHRDGDTDRSRNILILCPNCHKRFDHGGRDVQLEILSVVRGNFPGISLDDPD